MDENPYRGLHSDGDSPPQEKKGRTSKVYRVLALLGITALVICLLLPAVRTARPAARRSQCVNNLKQIALALQTYAQAYLALPPAYTVDADGKPLHSWRTLILPYVEEQRLYKTIDLAKPWNDPANAEAYKTGIDIYRCPSGAYPDNHTTGSVENLCFSGSGEIRLAISSAKSMLCEARLVTLEEVFSTEPSRPLFFPTFVQTDVWHATRRCYAIQHLGQHGGNAAGRLFAFGEFGSPQIAVFLANDTICRRAGVALGHPVSRSGHSPKDG